MLTYSTNDEKGDTGRRYYTLDNPWEFKPYSQRYMNTESDTLSVKFDFALNSDMAFDLLIAGMDYAWGFDTYEENSARQQVLRVTEDNITIDGKFRFGITNNNLFGFVGLAYFEREQDYASTSAYSYFGHDESDSKAIYGEASFIFAQDFTLTVGGRVERESQFRDYNDGSRSVLDQEKTITLPKAVLKYAFNDSTTGTISARKGYNAGGGALDWFAGEYYYYDSESVMTYETGLRSSLNGGNINLSANLFYNDYSDYQAMDLDRRISNIDSVSSYGLEAEVSAMVTSDLKLNAGVGVMSSEVSDDSPEFENIDGNELSSAPGITANMGATYWLTEGFSIRVSFVHVDEYYGEISNSEERIAGNYTLINGSINYELENWIFNAFVNNVGDKQAITVKEPPGRRFPDGYAGIVDPRTVGGSVTYRF